MLRTPPSSVERQLGVLAEIAFPCQPSLFSIFEKPLPLIVFATIDGRLAGRALGLLVGGVDLLDVVAVDLDRVPAEGAEAVGVGGEVPAVHRLAALAEPVDVDDRRQVVELVERGVLGRLPHRALGHLAVAADDPDAEREPVEALAGERHADADRQPLAERAGGDVDPRQHRASGAPRAASRTGDRSAAPLRRARRRRGRGRRRAARHGPSRRRAGRSRGCAGCRSRSGSALRGGRRRGRPPTSTRSDGPSPPSRSRARRRRAAAVPAPARARGPSIGTPLSSFVVT